MTTYDIFLLQAELQSLGPRDYNRVDLFVFIYLTCMSILTENVVCTTCLNDAPRARKTELDSLELELQMVVTTM